MKSIGHPKIKDAYEQALDVANVTFGLYHIRMQNDISTYIKNEIYPPLRFGVNDRIPGIWAYWSHINDP